MDTRRLGRPGPRSKGTRSKRRRFARCLVLAAATLPTCQLWVDVICKTMDRLTSREHAMGNPRPFPVAGLLRGGGHAAQAVG